LYVSRLSACVEGSSSKTEVPKPTEGMDYNYARKAHPTNIERKDVAHIWEIAGTRQFADEATEQENVFMGMRQVRDFYTP